MIQRCRDGSVVVLATTRSGGAPRAVALRLTADGRAAVLEARLARRRASGRLLAIEALASALAVMLASYALGGGFLVSVLAAVAVGAAVRVIARRLGGGAYLSGACEASPDWERVNSVAPVGRRSVLGRDYSVYSVRVGSSEYFVALTDEELRALAPYGF